jgi:hypothetical protein
MPMTVIDQLTPPVAETFRELVDGVWDGRVDTRLLEACRRRVCTLVGAPTDAGRHRSATEPPAADDPRVAACLAFTEMWVLDPHAMTDEIAEGVRSHLTDAEAAAFTIGLATMEAIARSTVALGLIR